MESEYVFDPFAEPVYQRPATPAEFEFEPAATTQQLTRLLAHGYDGNPIHWDYLTKRQADILLKRYAKNEPLWQGGRGEVEAGPALPQGGQGVLFRVGD